MSNTNRGVNRLVLLIVGVLALAGGAAVLTATLWAPAGSIWTEGAEAVRAAGERFAAQTPLPALGTDGLTLAVIAGILLVIVLLVVAIVRVAVAAARTHGHDVSEVHDAGRLTVTESFLSDALRQSLANREEILASQVHIGAVRRTSVLHVSVTPRQSTPPSEVAATVERYLNNLSTLTGETLPAFVSIHSGWRARLASDRRRVT